MTRPVVWLSTADAKPKDAASRYAEIRPALGLRFAEAVEGTIQAIAEAPLRFPVIDQGKHRAGVRRFPYGLFFLVEDTRIVVIA